MSDEEVLEVDTGHSDVELNKVQQRVMNHMLQSAQFMMGYVAHELKTDMPKASSVTLSVLSTVVMIFIRGYPRQTWAMQFRELAQYFERMATEAEMRGEADDGTSTPAG